MSFLPRDLQNITNEYLPVEELERLGIPITWREMRKRLSEEFDIPIEKIPVEDGYQHELFQHYYDLRYDYLSRKILGDIKESKDDIQLRDLFHEMRNFGANARPEDINRILDNIEALRYGGDAWELYLNMLIGIGMGQPRKFILAVAQTAEILLTKGEANHFEDVVGKKLFGEISSAPDDVINHLIVGLLFSSRYDLIELFDELYQPLQYDDILIALLESENDLNQLYVRNALQYIFDKGYYANKIYINDLKAFRKYFPDIPVSD